jgi:hypothetical protein
VAGINPLPYTHGDAAELARFAGLKQSSRRLACMAKDLFLPLRGLLRLSCQVYAILLQYVQEAVASTVISN